MRLSNIDIRHLRAFMAVVECGGFTAAESVLGISQSTISAHVAELERRLNFRLCERGRSGFVLTTRGTELHAAAIRLIGSFSDFEDRALALRGAVMGSLRLGLIDNMITDPNCRVASALAEQSSNGRGPRITIDVMPPAEIEYAIAAKHLDLGISIVQKRLPSLRYTPLYSETDVLFCGNAHDLYNLPDDDRNLHRKIRSAPKVIRSFLNHHDFFLVSDIEESIEATVTNIEAAAFLILSGKYIGFLPEHYASQWLRTGMMRSLLPAEFNRTSEIVLIEHANSTAMSPAVQAFADTMRKGITAHAPENGM